jgi:hypothetical protein
MESIEEILTKSDIVFLDSGARSGSQSNWYRRLKDKGDISLVCLEDLKTALLAATLLYEDFQRDDVFVTSHIKTQLERFRSLIRQRYLSSIPSGKFAAVASNFEHHKAAFKAIIETYVHVTDAAKVYDPKDIRAYYDFLHSINLGARHIRKKKRDYNNVDELLLATALSCSFENNALVSIISSDSDIHRILEVSHFPRRAAVVAYFSPDGKTANLQSKTF